MNIPKLKPRKENMKQFLFRGFHNDTTVFILMDYEKEIIIEDTLTAMRSN